METIFLDRIFNIIEGIKPNSVQTRQPTQRVISAYTTSPTNHILYMECLGSLYNLSDSIQNQEKYRQKEKTS